MRPLDRLVGEIEPAVELTELYSRPSRLPNKAVPSSASCASAARNSPIHSSRAHGTSTRNAAAPLSSGQGRGVNRRCGQYRASAARSGGRAPPLTSQAWTPIAAAISGGEHRPAIDQRRRIKTEAHAFDQRRQMPGVDDLAVDRGLAAHCIEPRAVGPGRREGWPASTESRRASALPADARAGSARISTTRQRGRGTRLSSTARNQFSPWCQKMTIESIAKLQRSTYGRIVCPCSSLVCEAGTAFGAPKSPETDS